MWLYLIIIFILEGKISSIKIFWWISHHQSLHRTRKKPLVGGLIQKCICRTRKSLLLAFSKISLSVCRTRNYASCWLYHLIIIMCLTRNWASCWSWSWTRNWASCWTINKLNVVCPCVHGGVLTRGWSGPSSPTTLTELHLNSGLSLAIPLAHE